MIFITGASGFVGSNVLNALLQKNEKICILSRRIINSSNNFEIVNTDLSDVENYKEQLKKTHTLIHIAGCAKAFSQDISEFYTTNFLATKKLILQALKCNVKKIIYISTCMIFGPSNTELSEDDFKIRNNFLNDYEKSKYLAEKFVRSKIKEGAPIIILYPTRIFGPGKLTQGNSLTKLILFFIKSKIFPVIESPSYIGNYVYIDDVVNLIVKAVYEINPPQTLLVAGYNLSFQQFFQILNNITGHDGRIITIKKTFALQLARFFENIEQETSIPALISRGWVQTFTTNWLFSNIKVQRMLSYSFFPFNIALEKTINWLKTHTR